MAEQQTNGHDKKPMPKWTPERRAKFLATVKKKGLKLRKLKRKPKQISKRNDQYEDALIYLRHAVAKMDGSDRMSDLLVKLALRTLEGE